MKNYTTNFGQFNTDGYYINNNSNILTDKKELSKYIKEIFEGTKKNKELLIVSYFLEDDNTQYGLLIDILENKPKKDQDKYISIIEADKEISSEIDKLIYSEEINSEHFKKISISYFTEGFILKSDYLFLLEILLLNRSKGKNIKGIGISIIEEDYYLAKFSESNYYWLSPIEYYVKWKNKIINRKGDIFLSPYKELGDKLKEIIIEETKETNLESVNISNKEKWGSWRYESIYLNYNENNKYIEINSYYKKFPKLKEKLQEEIDKHLTEYKESNPLSCFENIKL